MKLLASLTSPFARKVRAVLAEKHIECEMEVVNAWELENPVVAHNPLSQVPTLLLDDETSLFDSCVIVEYLDSMSPAHKLLPEPGRQRMLVRRLEALADGMAEAAVRIFLEKKRPAEHQDPKWIELQRVTIDRCLKSLSDELGDNSWYFGTRISLADVAVGCALGYLDLRFGEIDWRTAYPNLASYTEVLFKRPSFADSMPPK